MLLAIRNSQEEIDVGEAHTSPEAPARGSALADHAAMPDVVLPPAAVLDEAVEEEVVVPFQAHIATPSATPCFILGPKEPTFLLRC